MQRTSSKVNVLGLAISIFLMACTTVPKNFDQSESIQYKPNSNSTLTNKNLPINTAIFIDNNYIEDNVSKKSDPINHNKVKPPTNKVKPPTVNKNQNVISDTNDQKKTPTINKESKAKASQVKTDDNNFKNAQMKKTNKKQNERVRQSNQESAVSTATIVSKDKATPKVISKEKATEDTAKLLEKDPTISAIKEKIFTIP
jgi:hypothetical protein